MKIIKKKNKKTWSWGWAPIDPKRTEILTDTMYGFICIHKIKQLFLKKKALGHTGMINDWLSGLC